MTHGILSHAKDHYTDRPSPFNAGRVSWIPGRGAKIPRASWPKI